MKTLFLALLLSLAVVPLLLAGDPPTAARNGAEIIGVARGESRDPVLDRHLKDELDRLIPRIKKLGEDSAVLIEAYYPPDKAKKSDDHLRKAYELAEQTQIYLRNKHSLSGGIFISIWSGSVTPGDKPQIRLTSYPRTFFEN